MDFLVNAPRNLFITGKGGVGKTSVACAAAVTLAQRGARVLLVSTDPASNLDEVFGVKLSSAPSAVPGAERLFALKLAPTAAAAAYREKMVAPFRGILPDAAIVSIQEQLSGACAVEIATFDEFSRLLGDAAHTQEFDHVLFDTAPTGHTLRLLELPAATALRDAARTPRELAELGVTRQTLVLNGLFRATDPNDPLAQALEARGRQALSELAPELALLPRTELAASVPTAASELSASITSAASETLESLLPMLDADLPALRVTRLDPELETRRYCQEVLLGAGACSGAAPGDRPLAVVFPLEPHRP